MRNIELNNGNITMIADSNDALEVVGDKLSYELAEYLRSTLWNMEAMDNYIGSLERNCARLEEENESLQEETEEYERKLARLESELEKLTISEIV